MGLVTLIQKMSDKVIDVINMFVTEDLPMNLLTVIRTRMLPETGVNWFILLGLYCNQPQDYQDIKKSNNIAIYINIGLGLTTAVPLQRQIDLPHFGAVVLSIIDFICF